MGAFAARLCALQLRRAQRPFARVSTQHTSLPRLCGAGIPIKWSSTGFEPSSGASSSGGGGGAGIIPRTVVHFAALVSDLVVKSRDTCKQLFPIDSADDTGVKWLRLRTNGREVIIAPGDGCTLVVIQKSVKDDAQAESLEGGEEKEE